MKIASYNILQGGSKRVHWKKMINDQDVDLLCVQESLPQNEHLSASSSPYTSNRSVWQKVESNKWGSGIFSKTGTLTEIDIPHYCGWVVGAELSNAFWQENDAKTLVFSLCASDGPGRYAGQVNLILNEIAKLAEGKEVVIGGDFNMPVSHWGDSEIKSTKRELAVRARLANDFGLINCWQSANPGLEPQQTLRWTRNRTVPFHIDGIFVPKSWLERLQSCTILSGQEWDELSDHNPVIAEFS